MEKWSGWACVRKIARRGLRSASIRARNAAMSDNSRWPMVNGSFALPGSQRQRRYTRSIVTGPGVSSRDRGRAARTRPG
jgi:hypothetical protein